MSDNIALYTMIALIGFFSIAFYRYEQKRTTTREIALVATLAGISGVVRIPFAGLPNIQPTTFFVILTGYVFGGNVGFMVGVFSPIVTNMFIGQGPWTIWQMLGWGAAGASGVLLRFAPKNTFKLIFALYGFLWGFIFDYIMNFWHWLFFIRPLTLQSFIMANITSFYFDLLHGMGNFGFAWFLGKDVSNVLLRFKDKIYYKKID